MLGIGTYRAEQGVPYVFESVKKAEKKMAENQSVGKEYLHPLGSTEFRNVASNLLFKDDQ